MADEVVYTGTADNSGNGDPLRLAMQKINAEFESIRASFNFRGTWTTGTLYNAATRDYFLNGGLYYVTNVTHTSGVFATDLAAGRFSQIDLLALQNNLAGIGGSGMIGYVQPNGGVAKTVADRITYNAGRYPEEYKLAGDADDTASFQRVIDSFSGSRGTVRLSHNTYNCLAAKIDFKRCRIIGEGPIPNSGGGGSHINIGTLGGLYTSIEENSAPHLKSFRITSANLKVNSAQICLDLKGINYPRIADITITGGGTALRISGGSIVESHYGEFENININKAWRGISVQAGLISQSHNIISGRSWDCVVAYENTGTGASDINFYGHSFESEQAIVHEATAVSAQTKLFACRNESQALPEILAGQLTQIGTYWSGNRLPSTINVDTPGAGGFLKEANANSFVVAANNYSANIGRNLLPNPSFAFDPSALNTITVVPGWVPFGSTHFSQGKAHEGNYIRLERQAAIGTVGITSRVFPLKKGRYRFGAGFQKDGYGVVGSPRIDFLVNGVTAGAAGTYFDTTFPLLYQSTEYGFFVEVLQDIEQFQFRVQCDASTNGRYYYIYSPYLVCGTRSYLHESSGKPIFETYGVAMPTTGYRTVGDKHVNITPAVLGVAASRYTVTGWTRITTGSAHVLNTDWVEQRSLTGT